ncbi:MAG TPA: NAD(P)/FAD-dependent oxidoreductase [Saliniramus sp.]|nr:NAD(P)/FAD-dependent oxidoreductase [Saliniramus sp.]
MTNDLRDCIVIGGGPAGLTAAIYLARFRRNVALIDGHDSRAAWIPRSHNIPAFQTGVGGRELLTRMHDHAAQYDTPLLRGEVRSIRRSEDGVFQFATSAGDMRARFVILATGVVDVEPNLPDIEGAVQRGLVRQCPICDAFEVIDQRIAVIGHGDHGAREALFLRTYSPRVTLFTLGEPADDGLRGRMGEAGIAVVDAPLDAIAQENDRIVSLTLANGETHDFDTIYSALGCSPRNDLLSQIGARLGDDARALVDDHQETNIPGLYAAGDIVSGLNQVAVAVGQAAIAATAIHNRLPPHYR